MLLFPIFNVKICDFAEKQQNKIDDFAEKNCLTKSAKNDILTLV